MATTIGYCTCSSNSSGGGGEDNSKGSGGKNSGNTAATTVAVACQEQGHCGSNGSGKADSKGGGLVARVRATLVAVGAPRVAAAARATRCRGLQWHT